MEFKRRLADTQTKVEALCNKLSRFEKIGLDTESSGPLLVHLTGKKEFINIYRSTLTGISIALPDGTSYYVPISHRKGNAPLPAVAKLLGAIRDYTGVVAIANSKHELDALTRSPLGDAWLGFVRHPHCTQVLAWLVGLGEIHGELGLKHLAKACLGMQMSNFKDVAGGYDFNQLKPDAGLDYACEDAEAALLMHDYAWPMMAPYKGMEDTYLKVELPFVKVLRSMEDAGWGVDEQRLPEIIDHLQQEQDELKEQWNFVVGEEILLTSSTQLQRLFKDGHWSSKGVPKKKTGYSTEAEYIEKQLVVCKPGSLGYKAAEIKLRHSELSKLTSTYGLKMLEKAHQYPDFCLHPGYTHTGARTGRLSSSYPNAQNIPKRKAEGKRIREAFIPPTPGRILISADYSQIELRVAAHFCGKGMLFDAYFNGLDVHQLTADKFGVRRDQAKELNFGPIYGLGAAKMARKLRVTLDEARVLLREHREGMPEVFVMMGKAANAAERGYVRTLLNRIRLVPGLREARQAVGAIKDAGGNWNNSEEYREAWLHMSRLERIAGNTPVQGGARDIMTLAMLKVHELLDPSFARIIGQVHDDLILESDRCYAAEASEIIKHSMETAFKLKVPLVAEPVQGERWSDL